MKKTQLTLVLSLGAFACFGCDEDEGVVGTIDNRFDCRDICDRFGECYSGEGDYDVDNCADECRDNAQDEGFEDRVDDCENCLDDEDSCASDTLDCADECAGVVLQSG